MYGKHALPYDITTDEMHISLASDGQSLRYERTYLAGHFEKLTVTDFDERTMTHTKYYEDKTHSAILLGGSEVIIHPIEPLNKPVPIADHLEIACNNHVFIMPKSTERIFLTFPIEIGVFVPYRKREKLIDVITFARQKYTLYGPLNLGVVCRYWESDVHRNVPAVDPYVEGVIELALRNDTNEIQEITKVVFSAVGMKIFFDSSLVAMRGTMKILSKSIAETQLREDPLRRGMQKAIEYYQGKNIPMVSNKMVMEWGL